MKRVRKPLAGQNLDSLLDTLTNVVGILLLMLLVTHINVIDALSRIREGLGLIVDEARWAEVESQLALLAPEIATLRARAGVASLPASLEGAPGWWRDAARRSQEVAGARARASSLAREVSELRSRVNRIEVLASDDESGLSSSEPRYVRLPDPRPPPEGARELVFFCRYGRLIAVDVDALRATVDQSWRAAIAAEPIERVPQPDDFERILEYFDRVEPRSGPFALHARRVGAQGLAADLRWSDEGVGESARALQEQSSALRATLKASDAAHSFAHFFVWADSFSVYLAARRVAEDQGFAVGWVPQAPDDDISLVIAGLPSAQRFID